MKTCLLLLLSLPVLAGGSQFKVLVVGDSWADYMWQDQSLRTVFALEGFPQYLEKGDLTAISGSTAAEWKQPAMLQTISDELNGNPSIEVVQLSVGGNDFLAGMSGGGWHTGLSPAQTEALFMAIADDMLIIINHIIDNHPEMRILISLYDYPNFVETLGGLGALVCSPLWNDLGQPTPEQINQVQITFMEEVELLAAGFPQVEVVSHIGLMQFNFGYPSMGIGPGELLPPGDLTLPSPPESLRFGGNDCFHLNATGYQILAQNLWDNYYIDAFCATATAISQAQADWPQQTVLDLLALYNNQCP